MKKIFSFFTAAALAAAAKIIALDPAAVEILDALGAKEQIVGIAPPSAFDIRTDISAIKNVGSYMKPNIEQVFALQPDIVLASRHSLASASQLEKLGIKLHKIDANSFDEVRANISYLAKLSNTDASGVLKRFNNQLANIKKHPNKSAFVIFSAKPLMLFCGQNLINDALAAMQIKNACTASEQTPIVSAEYIAAAGADYLIYLGKDAAELEQLPLIKQLNSRIILANSSALLRGSQLIADEAINLSNRLGE